MIIHGFCDTIDESDRRANARPTLTTHLPVMEVRRMANKQCSKCSEVKPLDMFPQGAICRPCRMADQRQRRRENGNAETRRYEKTKSGFLMRAYRNMKSRVTGVQAAKFHLYCGKQLLPKEIFYEWASDHEVFHALFDAWEASGYDRKLTPTVDRIDPDEGYRLKNMEWVTHSENSRRGAVSKKRPYIAQTEAA
jgi:hypothetical protein